jgi:hypothetical protein
VKALRVAALLLTLSGVTGAGGAFAGCGGTRSVAASPAAERLQREDLVAVTRGLRQAEGSIQRETAAARIAWPLVAYGLSLSTTAARVALANASRAAQAILVPVLMSEAQSRSLTGPAAGIAGLFQPFSRLTERGWTLTAAAADEIASGTPAAARFARENVALYIDSIYDGHFDAALIGKSLHTGYEKLGGEAAFGGALPEAEVDALVDAYSPANEQLHPHPGVRLEVRDPSAAVAGRPPRSSLAQSPRRAAT